MCVQLIWDDNIRSRRTHYSSLRQSERQTNRNCIVCSVADNIKMSHPAAFQWSDSSDVANLTGARLWASSGATCANRFVLIIIIMDFQFAERFFRFYDIYWNFSTATSAFQYLLEISLSQTKASVTAGHCQYHLLHLTYCITITFCRLYNTLTTVTSSFTASQINHGCFSMWYIPSLFLSQFGTVLMTHF